MRTTITITRLISLFLVLSLLCSCTPIVIPSDQPTETTGEDIFTPTQQPTEAISPSDNTSVPSTDGGSSDFGPSNVSFKFLDKAFLKTESGRKYVPYNGGEVMIPCLVTLHGEGAAKHGMGFLIFLDGQPQPYRTDADKEYAFMHIFYEQDDEFCIPFTFTPVTGKAGDLLEFYIVPVFEPTLTVKEGGLRSSPSQGHVCVGAEIKMTVDPTEQDFPTPSVMLDEISMSKTDYPHSDIEGWSELDLMTRAASRLTVDNQKAPPTTLFSVTSERSLSLDVEVWGTPYVHYGLVFFVDYQPVTDADGNPIFLDVESGKKTLLHAMLDMSDFEEERVVFAVLVPRNRRTSEIKTEARLTALFSWFLLAREAKKN